MSCNSCSFERGNEKYVQLFVMERSKNEHLLQFEGKRKKSAYNKNMESDFF